MPDRYESMTELLALLPSRGNYEIQLDASRRSRVKLFAPHGGCIEPCTGPLVREIAERRTDWFVFHGMLRQGCFATLHVKSTHYDEPRCLQMAGEAEVAVALHGSAGAEPFLEVSGGNGGAVASLVLVLRDGGFPVRPPAESRQGEDARNFVNRARRQGVQLELSAGFRKTLFADYPRTLHPDPRALGRFVRALQGWIEGLEAELAAPPA